MVENISNQFELHHEKTHLMPYADNKGADQSAQIIRALISAFVVRCLDVFAKSKISRL